MNKAEEIKAESQKKRARIKEMPTPRDWPEVNNLIEVIKEKEIIKEKSVISNNILICYSALLTGFILGVLVTAYIA